MEEVLEQIHVSEQRVCKALEQPQSTQRYQAAVKADEKPLTERIVSLACEYGRYRIYS